MILVVALLVILAVTGFFIIRRVFLRGNDSPKNVDASGNPISGNSTGNISSGGHAVYDGEWIYYINLRDKGAIYKMKPDASENQKICGDRAGYLNIYGNWIIYSNFSENYNLYKIKKNGKAREQLNDHRTVRPFVYGEWVYYLNQSPLQEGISGGIRNTVWKMKFDGSQPTILSANEFQGIVVSDSVIYLEAHGIKGGDSGIYRMDLNGDALEKLFGLGVNINVVDGWIFFSNVEDDYKLYKMRNDGTELQKIAEDHAEYIVVHEEWIYYTNMDDGWNMYRVRIDGTEKEKLNDHKSYSTAVVENRIVFWDLFCEDFYGVYDGMTDGYIMDLDGSNETALCEPASLRTGSAE